MNPLKILENINIPEGTCEYWDIRIEDKVKTEIEYQNFELTSCTIKPSVGAFIRVYNQGMWFYSSTTDLYALSEEITDLATQSKALPKNSNLHLRPYNQTPSTDHLIKHELSRLDHISIGDKKNLCEEYFEFLKSFNNLKDIKTYYSDEYKVKYFRSSKDVRFSYDFNQCGLCFSYTAIDGEECFRDKINFYGQGLDDLKNLSSGLEQNIHESFLFTKAKSIEPGNYPVVMNSSVVGIFAHESFGHKSEADFMIGDEEAQKTWKLGTKIGNECLSIIDSGEEYGTSGYCPIDDEGFKNQKTYLIKDGVLTGRLHNQYTSQLLGESPTGNGRAINFEFEPLVRMTNTYLEPGNLSFNDLISQVKLGVYAKDVNHGSGMSTFTLAPRKCYMIRDGKLAEPIRVAVISGSVFETLNNVVGCSAKFNLKSSAFGGCGKMDQQPLPVGFGGPSVLVNEMILS